LQDLLLNNTANYSVDRNSMRVETRYHLCCSSPAHSFSSPVFVWKPIGYSV